MSFKMNNNKRKEKSKKRKKVTKNILKNVTRLNKNAGNIKIGRGMITVFSRNEYVFVPQNGAKYPNPKP